MIVYNGRRDNPPTQRCDNYEYMIGVILQGFGKMAIQDVYLIELQDISAMAF